MPVNKLGNWFITTTTINKAKNIKKQREARKITWIQGYVRHVNILRIRFISTAFLSAFEISDRLRMACKSSRISAMTTQASSRIITYSAAWNGLLSRNRIVCERHLTQQHYVVNIIIISSSSSSTFYHNEHTGWAKANATAPYSLL